MEMGLGSLEGDGFRIPFDCAVQLETNQIDILDDLVKGSPFTIELESSGWLGSDKFRYFYRFFLGINEVQLERRGCFVRRSGEIYLLDANAYNLIEAVDTFNRLPAEQKSSGNSLLKFGQVKGLAETIGAKLDQYLTKEKVLIPSRVGLDLIVEPEGRITFAPKIDGVPEQGMRHAFLASDDVEDVYAVDDGKGGRIRVVLDEPQREILKRMQRVRHLRGRDKVEVLRDPHSVFDGVAGEIDLGPRVVGIGDFPFVSRPFLDSAGTGIFDSDDIDPIQRKNINAGIECRYSDGSVERIPLDSRDKVLELQNRVKTALASGDGTLDIQGKSIVLDEGFVKALDELVNRLLPRKAKAEDKLGPKSGRYLLIYTNEGELEYQEELKSAAAKIKVELPKSLKTGVLQPHQLNGLEWLQRNFLLERRGCLLADDMGLGKTLQVLAFIAWLIERGELSPAEQDPDIAPWNPVLIIAPVILLENETWIDDMRKFFVSSGSVFDPVLVLHGARLNQLRRSQGRETVIGDAVLDLGRLRQYRIVLTNYETITNYQHSFAQMKERWTLVVTDEAQEYKTPSTKISHALKSLAPKLRVACTGTPVETRLLDVWNIFDFLQPGSLLGSAAEFRDAFERPLAGEGAHSVTVGKLKERLFFGTPHSFVLRRDKSELRGLPSKHDHKLECSLSEKQLEWHIDLLNRAHLGGEENHPFALIHYLMRVSQHPALVPRFEPVEARQAIDQCPKLQIVLDCLRSVKNCNEKALVFTRSVDMQQLLAMALGHEFGISIDIINGMTARKGAETHSAAKTRQGIIRCFKESRGFNVLVLSPDVAGLGLTLTEANHVIHYGRWWNPAKESQATDRVYRIGQEKEVHVYYPIAHHPTGEIRDLRSKT